MNTNLRDRFRHSKVRNKLILTYAFISHLVRIVRASSGELAKDEDQSMTTEQQPQADANLPHMIMREAASCTIYVELIVEGITIDSWLRIRIDHLFGALHSRITKAIDRLNQFGLNSGGFDNPTDQDAADSVTLPSGLQIMGRSLTVNLTISPKVPLPSALLVGVAQDILAGTTDLMHYVLDPEGKITQTLARTLRLGQVVLGMGAISVLGRSIAPLIKPVPGPHEPWPHN